MEISLLIFFRRIQQLSTSDSKNNFWTNTVGCQQKSKSDKNTTPTWLSKRDHSSLFSLSYAQTQVCVNLCQYRTLNFTSKDTIAVQYNKEIYFFNLIISITDSYIISFRYLVPKLIPALIQYPLIRTINNSFYFI